MVAIFSSHLIKGTPFSLCIERALTTVITDFLFSFPNFDIGGFILNETVATLKLEEVGKYRGAVVFSSQADSSFAE